MQKVATIEIELFPISALQTHLANSKIYNDEYEDVTELAEQIKKSGWIKPLVVNHFNVIISGHRRYRAAIKLGMKEIPIERKSFSSTEDEMEMLLLENHTRLKTIEQKVREAEAWRKIEEARARARKHANLRNNNRES